MKNINSKKLSLSLGISTLTMISGVMSVSAEQLPSQESETVTTISNNPFTGTMKTAAGLTGQSVESTQEAKITTEGNIKIAQSDVQPGSQIMPGGSYIGVAGNIGFTGNGALGTGNFAVISKVRLSDKISLRPAAIIGDDTDFLIPISYDINIIPADPLDVIPFKPYLGAGISFSTRKDSDVGLLLTGGVDVPLNKSWIGNAALNASIKDKNTDVGLILGVGYTFPGF